MCISAVTKPWRINFCLWSRRWSCLWIRRAHRKALTSAQSWPYTSCQTTAQLAQLQRLDRPAALHVVAPAIELESVGVLERILEVIEPLELDYKTAVQLARVPLRDKLHIADTSVALEFTAQVHFRHLVAQPRHGQRLVMVFELVLY